MFPRQEDKERGQSVVIIAFIVVILLALVAVVVDVGNAYAQRRIVQNAVDSATMAGVKSLSIGLENLIISGGDEFFGVTDDEVQATIEDYAETNGLEANNVVAWYIGSSGQQLRAVGTNPGSLVPRYMPDGNGVDTEVTGVSVSGDLPFDTYFAHMIGFDEMMATAPSKAWVLKGPCSGENLFPIALDERTFENDPGGAPVVGAEYTLWDHALNSPGNFGWLYWVDGQGVMRGAPPQSSKTPALSANILDTTRSGFWEAGDEVHGSTGVNFQPVLAELERRIDGDLDPLVVIPIYNDATGGGNNTLFTISGFGAFHLICARSTQSHYVEAEPGDCDECAGPSSEKCVRGYFERMVIPRMNDGCMDTGLTAPSFRPPNQP